MADIPVYLVTGFLDAGKTNFINGILVDGFARQEKTLLICCEEGEEDYLPNALDNVTVVTVEDQAALTCSQLKAWEKRDQAREDSFRGWLTRIVINQCRDMLRGQKKWVPMETLPDRPVEEKGYEKYGDDRG